MDLENEPAKKKAKTAETSAEDDETKLRKEKMAFVSFEKALNADWSSSALKKRTKRIDPSVFVLKVLWKTTIKHRNSMYNYIFSYL